MTSDDLELSRELTRLVRATDGVHDVYASGGVVVETAKALAAKAVTSAHHDDARVVISKDAVTVSVAVAAGFAAPDVLRAVSAVIAQHLAEVGRGTEHISVRAGRIE